MKTCKTVLTFTGGGVGLEGLLVVIVTPIFPDSLDSTSAFLFAPGSNLLSIGLSSLLQLLLLSASGGGAADGVRWGGSDTSSSTEPALVSSSSITGAASSLGIPALLVCGPSS